MGREIKGGDTDQSTVIRIIDSSDGTPETSVTSATSGLDLQYRREGAAAVALTESDLSALTDAHSDGGMLHIGAGYYRVDLPDAAVAAGADGVLVFGTVTNMVVIGEYHPLVAFDPQDAVRLGLTALPNAAADAAGGLPISDAGGLDLDTLDSNVSTILTYCTSLVNRLGAWTGSGVNTVLGAFKALLSKAASAPSDIGGTFDPAADSVEALRDRGDAAWITAAGFSTHSAADVRSEMDSNSTQLTAIVGDTNELQGDLTDGGRLDLLIDAILALLDDARGEPGSGAPPVNPDLATKIDYLYKWTRNKKDNDGSTTNFYADDGSTVDHTQTTSESGGTVTKGEIGA